MKPKNIIHITLLFVIFFSPWVLGAEKKSPCERPYLLDDALKLSTYFSEAKPMRVCDEVIAGNRYNNTNDAAFRLAGMVELYTFICPGNSNGKNHIRRSLSTSFIPLSEKGVIRKKSQFVA
ncbi:MAG: hypothetical protein COA63_008285 [Methylophaga sp.]|nr:hypothetical protein [Methylophaga sp.]